MLVPYYCCRRGKSRCKPIICPVNLYVMAHGWVAATPFERPLGHQCLPISLTLCSSRTAPSGTHGSSAVFPSRTLPSEYPPPSIFAGSLLGTFTEMSPTCVFPVFRAAKNAVSQRKLGQSGPTALHRRNGFYSQRRRTNFMDK